MGALFGGISVTLGGQDDRDDGKKPSGKKRDVELDLFEDAFTKKCKVGIRIVSGAVTAVAMAFVTPPVLDMLKRSLRAAQRA